METNQVISKSQGVMKGRVVVRSGIGDVVKTIDFETEIVHRYDDQGLGLEVAGSNDSPQATVYVVFKQDRQPSGEFKFPSDDIRYLAFIDGEVYPSYPAHTGDVTFQNHDGGGELRVNGNLNFKTENGAGGRYCEVDVVFSVTGITKPTTTLGAREKRLMDRLRAEAAQLNKVD